MSATAARAIRAAAAAGEPFALIAREHGVHPQTVRRIARGVSHVDAAGPAGVDLEALTPDELAIVRELVAILRGERSGSPA